MSFFNTLVFCLNHKINIYSPNSETGIDTRLEIDRNIYSKFRNFRADILRIRRNWNSSNAFIWNLKSTCAV